MRGASRVGLTGWQVAALAAAGGAGAMALASWVSARTAGPAYNVLEGEEGRFKWTRGEIAYRVKGRGAPIVLIHGVYAGASTFEYRRVFDLLAQHYRVYAFDLLGFGLSARPSVVYTPTLYESLIQDFVTQVVGAADHPVHVIASSLSAAFVIRAAVERPSLFDRLILIEPTGIERLANARNTPTRRLLLWLLRSPVAGASIHSVVASRPSIRYFLRRTRSDDRAVSATLVRAYYAQTHQPGARFALASFISGTLNTPVHDFYAMLKLPILVVWGKSARLNPLEHVRAFRLANPRTEIRILDCGDLPQDEAPIDFARDVDAWLRLPSRSRTR